MFRILFLIFVLCGVCFCGEYIFSYRAAFRDGIIYNEKYNFTPAMTLSRVEKSANLACEIEHNSKSEREFLKAYKEQILECFFKWGVKLQDRTESKNLKAKSISTLEIPPHRIKLEFTQGLASIFALK
ncbi:MAG: hypothetical protein SOW25_03475, partial [Helicobacter sp.]|nr:hypothetical protein [Helicobacter sp.]